VGANIRRLSFGSLNGLDAGSQAKQGTKKEPNPHFSIQWGKAEGSSMVEYSKALDDVVLPGRDFAAVMWYPPRQEMYRVAVHSYGKEYNECYIAIK
jgi:hypothetical protein